MTNRATDLYSAEYRFGCYQRYSQRRIMERQPRLPRHRGWRMELYTASAVGRLDDALA